MVSCDDCGACCTKPFIGNDNKNYAFVEIVHGQRVRFCKQFDCETFKCKIYNERPSVCRDYPVGGQECLSKRRLFNLKL
jgi:uncharacterized cysteine cluster protein YcgN (CxxCxxCC family)